MNENLSRSSIKFFTSSAWKKKEMLKIVVNEEMVFCYKNCSGDREKLSKFKAEGREFVKFLRLLKQFIQTLKGLNNFW